jgi:hypothetical protein
LGFGNPVQRPDGFWESNYRYSFEDPTYSVSVQDMFASVQLCALLHVPKIGIECLGQQVEGHPQVT